MFIRAVRGDTLNAAVEGFVNQLAPMIDETRRCGGRISQGMSRLTTWGLVCRRRRMVCDRALAAGRAQDPAANTCSISGVVSAQRTPLPGAVISLVATDGRAVDVSSSGVDGSFTLKAPAGQFKLTSQLTGFARAERDVTIDAAKLFAARGCRDDARVAKRGDLTCRAPANRAARPSRWSRRRLAAVSADEDVARKRRRRPRSVSEPRARRRSGGPRRPTTGGG